MCCAAPYRPVSLVRVLLKKGPRQSPVPDMKLLPLDSPQLLELAAGWLGRQENSKWLDFGHGVHVLSPLALKIMTQRDLHVLRAYTPDESDLPIGLVALSNADRASKTASSPWAVLGRQHSRAPARRAASTLLTL